MPTISLPDGSRREYSKPIIVAEVAADIGAGLARAALAGKVDGVLVDTSTLLESDVLLAIITDRDPEGLDIYVSLNVSRISLPSSSTAEYAKRNAM